MRIYRRDCGRGNRFTFPPSKMAPCRIWKKRRARSNRVSLVFSVYEQLPSGRFLSVDCAADHAEYKHYRSKDGAASGKAGIFPPGVPGRVGVVAPSGFAALHSDAELEEHGEHREQAKQSQRRQLERAHFTAG